MYDHQTESLWSQLLEKSVSGPMVGRPLIKLPSKRMKWKNWLKKNKRTFVLSDKTGFIRDYSTDPYKGYYRIGSLIFPVGKVRKDMRAKERILGIKINQTAKAYRLSDISIQKGILTDSINRNYITIHINKDGEVVDVTDQKGISITYIFSYWFAWQAFHPHTLVYKHP